MTHLAPTLHACSLACCWALLRCAAKSRRVGSSCARTMGIFPEWHGNLNGFSMAWTGRGMGMAG